MCRSKGEPCGERRCPENVPRRRARQRVSKAIQAVLRKQTDAPPSPEVALMSAENVDEGWVSGVPTVEQVMARIEQAEQAMAEADLSPDIVQRRNDVGHRPSVYADPDRAPMRFDQDQGWEVPTEQGSRLDLAVRKAGAAIEARAMTVHREPSTLDLDQITETRRSLDERRHDITGTRRAVSDGKGLSDALRLRPGAPATFESAEEYRTEVQDALALTEDALRRQRALAPGQNVPDVLTYDEVPRYEAAQSVLADEASRIATPGTAPSAWVMHQARLDSDARLAALREVREMGGAYAPGFLVGGSTRARRPASIVGPPGLVAKHAIESTSRVMPSTWVEDTSGEHLRVEAGSASQSSRFIASPKRGGVDDPSIRLSNGVFYDNGPMTGWESNALHEMGHYMEFRYPEINQIARTHKALRSTQADGTLAPVEVLPLVSDAADAGPRPERMDTTSRFGPWGRRVFGVEYAGQETGPRGSEVFSTGLESAFGGRYGALRGHDGTKADPEHLHLVLGILASVRRR